MERRLKLHEKLKSSTKLNKMTVKQGDILVTLNLKKDIGDPSVEISDKVLYMLEQFVEKQQNKTLNSSISQINTNNKQSEVDVTLLQKSITAQTQELPTNTKASPSKRVRFDLTVKTSDMTENLADPFNSSKSNEISMQKESYETLKKRIDTTTSEDQSVTKNFQLQPVVFDNIEASNASVSIQKENEVVSSQASSISSSIINATDNHDIITNVQSKIDKNEDKSTKNKSKKLLENQQTDQEDQEDDVHQNLLFNCRLCRLKFNNRRGLHEHVARIHGGKGGSFNLSLFAEHSNQEDDNEETSYEDDDFEEDDESNDPFNYINKIKSSHKNNNNNNTKKQIWNNQFKKKKLPHSNLPHPNVAIRVAKVAYYNSKIGHSQTTSNVPPTTQSNTNAFKSAIFTNGGIRGNFFSQERLPLRSCKIKMKLTPSCDNLPVEIEENDNFLSYSNVLKVFKPIDRNTTITFQATVSHADTDDDTLTDQEVREFYKSLLVYIPLNTSTDVIRLDDLIKLSQDSQENILSNELLVDSLRLIHEIVRDSKQFGISLYDLKKNYINQINSEVCLKMNMIIVLLQLLIDNYLVLAVGVVKRVYVAHEFKQHWVIESCKNQKGRGNSILFENEKKNEISEEEMDQVENSNSIGSRKRNSIKLADDGGNGSSFQKNYKPICLVPRPWRYIDGILNRPALQRMFETILIYLKSNPGANFDTIAEHFCPVLQPIMTLELLEMLEKCKCLSKLYLKKETTCDLFTDFQNSSTRVINDEDMDGDEMAYYYCKPNSIFTIKKLFQSSNSSSL